MFKDTSIQVREYLAGLTEFTAVMQRDSKLFLFPVIASIDNALPISTYILGERVPETKDKSQVLITLNFWFDIESYDQCCEFTDAIANKIDNDFILQSASIEYNEESECFSGIINFNLI
jgi:hypothetical protein